MRIREGIGPLLTLCTVMLVGSLAGCGAERPGGLVDLTYSFGQDTVYWPHNKPFQWEKTDWGMTAGGYWYASATFSASEHGGTHLDAPIHFGQGRRTVDQIPLEQLTGAAIVIDVRSRCQEQPDYELTVEDLQAWESRYGSIPDGAIVLMLSGWGQRWPDRQRYLGSQTPDDPLTLHFPGFSREAASFLVAQRAVRGLGIDTASIDPGNSRNFPVHQVLGAADVYALENVASLERLPPRGAILWALPIKINGGTGSPVRIVAQLP